jgi:arylsulfatase A-like enzyme
MKQGPNRRFAPWLRTLVVVLGCGLAATLFVAFPGRPDSAGIVAAGTRPDIVLITIDALRADHLGVYGYDRPTSPNLDALARESAVIRDHIAQAPYTKSSVASLFTGRFGSSHKAHTISLSFGAAMAGHVGKELPVTDVLDPGLWTLASALSSVGYSTIGLTTNPFLLKDFGFANGFSRYQFLAERGEFTPARDVLREGLAAIERPDRQPVFVWMHLMEPHSPYTPSAPVRSRFPPRQPARVAPREVIPPWLSTGGPLDTNFYEALYDGEIAEVDAALGEFTGALRRSGRFDQMVFVVTSDHGEEFFEHGGFEHSRTLYDEMLRVPLLIKAPGVRPGMREIQTQSVDLAPTLAGAVGAGVPSDLAGADLAPVLLRGVNAEPIAFSEKPGERYAVRTREWKLISSLDGQDELYHLTVDPREQVDLAAKDPQQAARLRERLGAVLAQAYQAGAAVRRDMAPVSQRTLDRLKALGYLR